MSTQQHLKVSQTYVRNFPGIDIKSGIFENISTVNSFKHNNKSHPKYCSRFTTCVYENDGDYESRQYLIVKPGETCHTPQLPLLSSNFGIHCQSIPTTEQ